MHYIRLLQTPKIKLLHANMSLNSGIIIRLYRPEFLIYKSIEIKSAFFGSQGVIPADIGQVAANHRATERETDNQKLESAILLLSTFISNGKCGCFSCSCTQYNSRKYQMKTL